AADDVEFLEIAEALGDADGRVVLQDVGDAAGLLVARQFLGEAGGGEGRVHYVHRPEQTDPPARGHLTASIGRGQGDLRPGDDDVRQTGGLVLALLRPGR